MNVGAKKLVAVIGRPNVGKSTIFNRFVGRRIAIVDEMEGVTRDRIYGECEWEGNRYSIVDCGGIAKESADPLHRIVSENALEALHEADLVLFIVDARVGVTVADDLVKREIWKTGKPVILVINKVDSKKYESELYDFYSLGISDMVHVSAVSGRNIHELLDLINNKLGFTPPDDSRLTSAEKRVIKEERVAEHDGISLVPDGEAEDEGKDRPRKKTRPKMTKADDGAIALDGDMSLLDYMSEHERKYDVSKLIPVDEIEDEPESFADYEWRSETIRISLLGRQNVGKSSLANAFVEEARVLVSELPGTTRDPIELKFEWNGRTFTVLDTAGLKRLSKVKESVDYYSMVRTSRRLPETDVSILIVDAVDGIYEMDKLVAKRIGEEGKAVVVAVNKWDLADDTPEMRDGYINYVYKNFTKLGWADVVLISALKHEGLDELLGAVVHAWDQYHRRVPNDVLCEVLFEEVTLHPPPVMKNNPLKIFDVRQVAICPPTIKIWINLKKSLHFSYRGFIENTIRSHFSFKGTFLNFIFEERKRKGRKW